MTGFDFWAACKAAIAIDSTTKHGNAEYVDFLKKILEPLDLKVRTQAVDADGYRGLNLIGEKGAGPDVVLFDTHLDTVSPGDPALWTQTGGDPFRAVIEDGKIFGLGAVDVKLDFLCKLKALEKYAGKRFRNRFILLGTFAEEVGLLGAQAFLEGHPDQQIDFALIGEPTSLKLVNRHKGRACYEFRIPAGSGDTKTFSETVTIEFQGESVHSSTPAKGVNAVEIAMDALAALPVQPEFFSIEGGHLMNIVPESCRIVLPAGITGLDRLSARASVKPTGAKRLIRSSGALAFWAAAREVGRRLASGTTWVWVTAKTADDAFVFEFDSRFWEDAESVTEQNLAGLPPANCRTIRKTPSFFETSTAWYVEGLCGALEEVGVHAEFASKEASTEAALFGHRCTTLVFGPGPSEKNAHRPNEYNFVSEIETAIRAYESILRRLVLAPNQ